MKQPKRNYASASPIQGLGEALAGRVVNGLRYTTPLNVAMFAQDIGGNLIRNATGNTFINNKKIPLTEKHLSPEVLSTLQEGLKTRQNKDAIRYGDYGKNGNMEGQDFNNIYQAVTKPGAILGTTLGQAAVKENKDNYQVTDTFDFNDAGKGYVPREKTTTYEKDMLKVNSERDIYSNIRKIASNLGSPDGEGIPVNIKVKKKFAMGGMPFQLGAQAINSIDGVDGKTSTEGSVLSGVLSGAGQGAALGPYGAAAGAVIGGALSIFTANQKAKQEATARERQLNYLTQQKEQQSKSILANYPTSGVSNGYYAQGGLVGSTYEVEKDEVVQGNPLLEQSTQMASDMHLVGGNSHEQGGTDGMGGERVYSDRLKVARGGKTYADLAARIGKSKGKMEDKLDSNSTASINTANRMLPRLDNELDNLFVQQEMNKTNKSGKKFAVGGTLPGNLNFNMLDPNYNEALKQAQLAQRQQAVGQVVAQPQSIGMGMGAPSYSSGSPNFAAAAPFVDNAVNALMTANTPNLPKPIATPLVNLDANYNINPQLNEIRTGTRNAYASIDANNSNSGTANSNKQAIFASSLDASNTLYGQKANQDANTRNREALVNSQITTNNNQNQYQNQVQQSQRRAGIQSDIAGNATNFASDLYTGSRDQAMINRDIENTKMIMAMNPDSAQYLDVKQYEDTFKRNPQLLQRMLAMLPEGNPNRERLLALAQ